MIGFKGGALGRNGKRKGVIPRFDAGVHYLLHGSYSVPKDFPREETSSRVSWLTTRNLPSEDPWHAVEVMKATARKNSRVKEPGYHMGASLPPEESLDREQWEAVADAMLARLDLEKHQAVIALHEDRGHQHIHVIVNRVNLSGFAWKPSFDEPRLAEVMRAMERWFELRRVPTRSQLVHDPDEPPPPPAEMPWSEQAAAARIRRVLGKELRAAETWGDLDDLLAAHGLRLQAAKRGSGAVVREGEHTINLSKVDRTLSGVQLARRFGELLRAYLTRRPDRPPLRPQRIFLELEDARGVADGIVETLSSRQATWTEQDVQILSRYHHDPDLILQLATSHPSAQRIAIDAQGEIRFTHHDSLKDELLLFDVAERLRAKETRSIDPDDLDLESMAGVDFDASQEEVLIHVAAQSDLALIQGAPGSGKTTVLAALAEAHRSAGHEVAGLSTTATGAQHLRDRAGIRTQSFYGWRNGGSEKAGTFAPGSVVLVDQAEQLASRELNQILVAVERAGGKAVLAGDPEGLQPIAPGAGFRGLAEQHGALELTSNHRAQIVEVDAVAEHDDLRWLPTHEDAVQTLAESLVEQTEQLPDDLHLAITATRAEAAAINRAASMIQRERSDSADVVRVRDREFVVGDRIRLTRGGRFEHGEDDSKIFVPNGSLGTVDQVDESKLALTLDDGQSIQIDVETFDHLDHGYALHVHQVAGREIDHAHVLITERLNRHAARVALSRHRVAAHLYAERETFPTDLDLTLKLAHKPTKDLVSDYGRLAFGQADEEKMRDVVRKLEAHKAVWTLDNFKKLTRDYETLAPKLLEAPDTIRLSPKRFTTRRYVEQELSLIERAATLTAQTSEIPAPHQLAEVAARHDLSLEKCRALDHAASHRLALITGRAGAGKTHLTRALVDHFNEAGQRVRGAAFTGKAAETLGQAAEIDSQTLASHTIGWQRGEKHLSQADVLIVDEASLVDVSTMDQVLGEVERAGARLVLIGDPYQLPAIGAGDAFRALLDRHPSATLETIYRQRHDWMIEASREAAKGQLGQAVRAYEKHDALTFVPTTEDGHAEIARTYLEHHRGQYDQALVLADRRADVAAIKQAIHDARVELGELQGGLSVRGQTFSVGDRIVLGANDASQKHVRVIDGEQGVRNGSLGTIVGLQDEEMTARLDDGRVVAFDPRIYQRYELGYATTVHKAQGQTVDHAYYLASPVARRQSAYVALTRHRESLRVFVPESAFENVGALIKSLDRSRGKSLAADYVPPPKLHQLLTPEASHEPSPRIEPARKPAVVDDRVSEIALQSLLDRLHAFDRETQHEQDLVQEIATLQEKIDDAREDEPRNTVIQGIETIFRHPATARKVITEAFGRQGTEATLDELAHSPEIFGKLRWSFRHNFRQQAHNLAKRAAQQRQHSKGPEIERKQLADREAALRGVRESLTSMTPGDQLRVELGALTQSVSPPVLAQLPADDYKLVTDLRDEHVAFIAKVHELIHQLENVTKLEPGAQQTPVSTKKKLQIQHALVTLVRAASRHAVYRLSPPALRMVMRTATTLRMPKAILYKLAPPHLRPVLYAASLVKRLARGRSHSR